MKLITIEFKNGNKAITDYTCQFSEALETLAEIVRLLDSVGADVLAATVTK